VYSAEYSIVTIRSEHGSIGCKVGPVPPVRAFWVFAIFLIVLPYKAIAVLPHGLHDARPRVANANVACFAGPGFHLLPALIVNNRVNAQNGRACAAGLHCIQSRLGGTQKATGFGLPPGVD